MVCFSDGTSRCAAQPLRRPHDVRGPPDNGMPTCGINNPILCSPASRATRACNETALRGSRYQRAVVIEYLLILLYQHSWSSVRLVVVLCSLFFWLTSLRFRYCFYVFQSMARVILVWSRGKIVRLTLRPAMIGRSNNRMQGEFPTAANLRK